MLCVFCVVLLCFKQKTAYEMRISDWSSDVCSSDLRSDKQACKLRQLIWTSNVSRWVQVIQLPVAVLIVGKPGPQHRRGNGSWLDRIDAHPAAQFDCPDRKNVGSGKSGSVHVYLGGRSISQKK